MKEPQAFTCDACGVRKGATNHWRIVTWVQLLTGNNEIVREIRISEWRDELAAKKEALHACGNNCSQKLLERWLSSAPEETATPAADPAPAPVHEEDCA